MPPEGVYSKRALLLQLGCDVLGPSLHCLPPALLQMLSSLVRCCLSQGHCSSSVQLEAIWGPAGQLPRVSSMCEAGKPGISTCKGFASHTFLGIFKVTPTTHFGLPTLKGALERILWSILSSWPLPQPSSKGKSCSPYMSSMKTCNSVTFYFMKNSLSDSSRKCILPNMCCGSWPNHIR